MTYNYNQCAYVYQDHFTKSKLYKQIVQIGLVQYLALDLEVHSLSG